MEQAVDVELNPDEDVDEEMNEYVEEMSESEYLDAMDELEDSTEAQCAVNAAQSCVLGPHLCACKCVCVNVFIKPNDKQAKYR